MQYKRNAASDRSKQASDMLDFLDEYMTDNSDVFSDEERKFYHKFIKDTVKILNKFSEENETKPLNGIQLIDEYMKYTFDLDKGYVERLEEMAVQNNVSPIEYLRWTLKSHLINNHDMMKVHYNIWKESKKGPEVEWSPPVLD